MRSQLQFNATRVSVRPRLRHMQFHARRTRASHMHLTSVSAGSATCSLHAHRIAHVCIPRAYHMHKLHVVLAHPRLGLRRQARCGHATRSPPYCGSERGRRSSPTARNPQNAVPTRSDLNPNACACTNDMCMCMCLCAPYRSIAAALVASFTALDFGHDSLIWLQLA